MLRAGGILNAYSGESSMTHSIDNPSGNQPDKDASYQPIDCNLHDQLESLAVQRTPSRIRYLDSEGQEREATGLIEDVYADEGAEYIRVNGGEVIRLDRLILVDDGNQRTDFQTDPADVHRVDGRVVSDGPPED